MVTVVDNSSLGSSTQKQESSRREVECGLYFNSVRKDNLQKALYFQIVQSFNFSNYIQNIKCQSINSSSLLEIVVFHYDDELQTFKEGQEISTLIGKIGCVFSILIKTPQCKRTIKKLIFYNYLIRLMPNGSTPHLNLLSFQEINGIVMYSIEVHVQGQNYLWKARYSALKNACQQFPHSTVKFPPKNSIRHVLSQISGSQEFLLERFNFMKEYFDAVSLNTELRFNKAFMQIYRHLQHQKAKKENQQVSAQPPKTPVIKGKKLEAKKKIEGPLYVVN